MSAPVDVAALRALLANATRALQRVVSDDFADASNQRTQRYRAMLLAREAMMLVAPALDELEATRAALRDVVETYDAADGRTVPVATPHASLPRLRAALDAARALLGETPRGER